MKQKILVATTNPGKVAELRAMLDDNFLIDAIEYELGNHEYCITHDPEQTLNALGIDLENNDERVVGCFEIAKKNYLDAGEVEGW